MIIPHIEIIQAEQRIRPYSKETPLEYSLSLSQSTQAEVWLKLENLQLTGSFKLRGALNKLLSLGAKQMERPVVTASTGNHGAGLAYGLKALGRQGIIFVPEHADQSKVDAVRRLGAEIRVHGSNCLETEIFAREYAEENGLTYISAYNDRAVIAGQGTIGSELARQTSSIAAVFAAVGGGGMISGIASFLKTQLPNPVSIIGCLPENSPEMALSVRAGKFIEFAPRPTISDGTAGGFERGAITYELCRDLVDDYVLVSEAEIGAAMRSFIETHHLLIEGAAGVALAGFLKTADQYRGRKVVIVICGANIGLAALKTIL